MTAPLYTPSRLNVLRSCLYKHHLRYTLNLRGPETNVMRFGTAAHAALEAYFLAWKAGTDRLEAAIAVINAVTDDADRAKLLVLIAGYDAKWGQEEWEILAVEVEFVYELDGYHLGGKIDAIVRDLRDGQVYTLEHKSTAQDTSPGSPYWSRLAIDTQVSIYHDGAGALGYTVAGCIYDVLVRPGHELKLATPDDKRKYTIGKGCKKCGGSAKAGEVTQGKGFYTVSMVTVEEIKCEDCTGTGWKLDKAGKPEAPRLHSNQRDTDETFDEFVDRMADEIAADPDAFYRRGVVVRLDDEIAKLRADLIDTIRVSEVLAAARLAPKNPDACSAYGSLCSFFDICSSRASVDDEIRFPRGTSQFRLRVAA